MSAKYDSDGNLIWSNSVSGNRTAVPAFGGSCQDEMVPPDVNFEVITPDLVFKDLVGNVLSGVFIVDPPDVRFEVIPPGLSGVDVEWLVDPPDVSFEVGQVQPAAYFLIVPPDVDFEVETVVPAIAEIIDPPDVEFEVIAPGLSGVDVAWSVDPPDVEFEVETVYPFNYKKATVTVIFTVVPPDVEFEVEAVTPYAYFPVVPADVEFEVLPVPIGAGFIVDPPDVLFEVFPTRIMFFVPADTPKKIFYACTLTGETDGTDDIVLPISNLSIRLRDGDPTYCGVTVPNVALYAPEVVARPNGQIVIYRGYQFPDGGQLQSEICRVDLDSFSYASGSQSSTVSIAGHITEENRSPETIDVRPLQMMSLQSDGSIRVRSMTNFFLRPGDTVIYGDAGETMVAGLVTISVGNNMDQMEIAEASS